MVMDLFRELAAEQQVTVVVVTHDDNIIDRLDRIIVCAMGDSSRLRTTPVAKYSGSGVRAEGSIR